jgi:hypothetical protein
MHEAVNVPMSEEQLRNAEVVLAKGGGVESHQFGLSGGGAGLFTKAILRLVPMMDKSHSRVSPNLSLLVHPGSG